MGERVIEAGGLPLVRVVDGAGPVVALALHAGHTVRPEVAAHLALDDDERLREEDPHTAQMAPSAVTLVEVLRSRFEVDLNRPRYRAVYTGPEDAWGLNLYRDDLPDEDDRESRAVYDTFYAAAFDTLSRVAEKHERFVVLDLHSYNHRRDGALAHPAPRAKNPEVNLGTGHIDRERWAPVVSAFSTIMDVRGFDCRENVKFRGGHFAAWVAETFPDNGATLAIEFKKTYMDEWTGEAEQTEITRIRRALETCVPALERALRLVP